MPKIKSFNTGWYLISDLVASILAWTATTHLRKTLLGEAPASYTGLIAFSKFYYQSLIPAVIFWLILYAVGGAYNSALYKRLKLEEFAATCLQCLIGSLMLLFIIFLNDKEQHYTYFYTVFFALFFLQTALIFVGRLLLINNARKHLKDNQALFNTIIVGSSAKAVEACNEIKTNHYHGYNLLGFVALNDASVNSISTQLSCLGTVDKVETIIYEKQIHQVVIAIENTHQTITEKLISTLSEHDVEIKIMPDTLAILSGSVKVNDVPGTIFIDIDTTLMPAWQSNIKRLIDVGASIISLIVLSPLIAYVAVRTKYSSAGNIFFSQERIGYKGKCFCIYKFRSMYEDAEKNGPALSSENDKRITTWGKTMRKWRLDELPQLWNILKGEMSFVGPRPERKFYIDEINKHTPYFRYLLKVKPGLTSWGMVQFGYASSVDEMIKRMKYDLVYIENISLLLDLKIMLYTLRTIFLGKGK